MFYLYSGTCITGFVTFLLLEVQKALVIKLLIVYLTVISLTNI